MLILGLYHQTGWLNWSGLRPEPGHYLKASLVILKCNVGNYCFHASKALLRCILNVNVCRWRRESILLLCLKWPKLPRGGSLDIWYRLERQERCGICSPGLDLGGYEKANFIGREVTIWEREAADLEVPDLWQHSEVMYHMIKAKDSTNPIVFPGVEPIWSSS